jgi:hypothetical protein
MTDYREQLRSAVRAARVTSSSAYAWFGRRTQAVPPAVVRQLPADTARAWLAADLHRKLYRGFYCHGTALPQEPRVQNSPNDGKTPFIEALSAANTGKGAWQSGWRLRESGGELVVVEKNGLSLRVAPEHTGLEPPIAGGATARVWMPKEHMRVSPGFYVAVGDADLSTDSGDIWRFYWRFSPDGALAFMRTATSLLNAAGCPFRLKTVASRDNFSRNDSLVLYLSAGEPDRVFELLPQLVRSCEADLLPGAPALTLSLAQGLNWAEDPGTGESYGWRLCRLIADAIVRAHERGERALEARLRIVEDRLREEGIDPERPYLRSAASERPAFPALAVRRAPSVRSCTSPEPDSFLQAARAIGGRLCDEAIWHDGRCTWIGAEPADLFDLDAASREPVYCTLGPDLYDGVAGIALFLADLYQITGDPRTRETAAAAIRQALHCLHDSPTASALGLYAGWLGVAAAAVRVGAAIAAPELSEQGAAAATRVMREYDGRSGHDLVSGRAGGLLASLALARAHRGPSFLAFAVHLGDELLDAADKDTSGWSWPSQPFAHHRNLVGFSHGASGIALALLELFVAVGNPKYREAAERALDYEAAWFDVEAGNWPDLRAQTRRGKGPGTFLTAWCHGAPGIALSRAHAFAVLGARRYAREAETALATTAAAIAHCLESGTGNFLLCHGVAGNAAIVADVARQLGVPGAGALADLASAVGDHGIRVHGGPNREWPSGASAGETPGLLLGLAGVGHFYLRLYDPYLPSILMPPTATPSGNGRRNGRTKQRATRQETIRR